MAFHLPKEPIRTKREFLLYLLATAAGVLLALSLEIAGSWRHTRTLVAEATGFFTLGLRIHLMDNLAKGLDDACANIQKERSGGL